jgi:YidC/Oxa1 family membrane protein insertase
MTPSGMDPRQAKMMLLMPVVFTFLFLNFASGLVLYWLVNNILGIGQQFFVNRKITKEQA